MATNPQEAITKYSKKYSKLIEDLAKPKISDPVILNAQQSAVQIANTLTINDPEDYLIAGEYRKRYRLYIMTLEAICEPFVKLFFSAHRLATAHRAELLAPFIQADQILEQKRIKYAQKVEAERQAKQRAAEEEARKKQKEDADREAARLEEAGEPEAAAEVRDMASILPPPMVQVESESLPEVPSQRRTYWKWELIDASKVKDEFWCPDEKLITDQVNSLGRQAENIVGKGSIKIIEIPREHMRSK